MKANLEEYKKAIKNLIIGLIMLYAAYELSKIMYPLWAKYQPRFLWLANIAITYSPYVLIIGSLLVGCMILDYIRKKFRARGESNCKFCGTAIPTDTAFCPKCGKSQK